MIAMLHLTSGGEPITFFLAHVVAINPHEGGGCEICTDDGTVFEVEDSYDDVLATLKAMIA
jgi:hypothetical protein